jgi:probable DNA repair protein
MRLACADLFSRIEKGAIIVTPTRLLATVAAEQFSNHQLASGIESWRRPSIISIGAWLASRWQEARYTGPNIPTLLSPSQEHVLWQRLIEEANPNLFNGSATARLGMRAAKLISEWQIPVEGDAWNNHEDGRQFLQWYKQFRRECADHNWITRADLWRLVPQWLASASCSTESAVFVGFSRPFPAFDHLVSTLGRCAQVDRSTWSQPAGRIIMKPFSDAGAELEYAARWARSAVERDPLLSIGVVIPDLPARRSAVERIFQHVFYPSAARSAALAFDRGQAAFHINAPVPLSDTPLVRSAFLLLELASNRIRLADAGAILRSPFIKGADSERNRRALADAKLRRGRSLDVTLRDLENASADCEILKAIWPKVRNVVRQPAIMRDVAGWSKFIGDLLAALGWPGDVDLTHDEQEILESWKDGLSSLSALGLVSGAVTLDAAIRLLSRILGPAPDIGNWPSPVQIFSPADAAGIAFDEALVTGLSHETWPPRVDVSPLVPLKLQRACGVPGSGPESLRAEAQRASASLFDLAPVLKGTYSGRPSPFIRKTAIEEITDSAWAGKLPVQSYSPVELEQLEDSRGPVFFSIEIAHGGSGIIKSQSQCPFRAFAEYRLNARPLEEAALGFDARERGGFLHKALQIVWQQLGNQLRLRSMRAEELRQLVEGAVTEAVHQNQFEPFHQIASSAERQRLRDLILLWLEIERSRNLPFTVETVEEERFFEVPGLRLCLRVDRIDRLQNGNLVLIDYKSGSMSRNKLKCPRPPEPQLLVYASAMEGAVDGVFFAELQARDPRAIGLSREKHFESKSVDVKGLEWDSVLSESEAEVVRLANEFVQGYAAVHPIHGACEYCSAKAICRVNEMNGPEETAE